MVAKLGHWCRACALIVAVFGALLISVSEFVQLKTLDISQPNEAIERLSGQQSWGGYAARQAAAQLTRQWRLDPALARAHLAWALERYPLDAWRWLTLARIEQAQGADAQQVGSRLITAHATQPQHPEINWEVINLSQRLGDPQVVLSLLYRWLQVSPRSVNEALFIADRWVDDLPASLSQILPPDEQYWVQTLAFAHANQRPELAETAWAALSKPRALDDPALVDYLVYLANQGAFERLQSLWAQYDVSYADTGVPGGHFHVPQRALSQFGWDVQAPAGVRILRQTHDLPADLGSATWRRAQGWRDLSPGALTIEFDGEHNVHLTTPKIEMPAPAPGRYRLAGWWKASRMTTRSLPRLEVATVKTGARVGVDLPRRDFPWTPFDVVVEVTQPDEMMAIQLVRRRTQAFDRYIEGSLSLTGLRLEPIAPSATVEAPNAQRSAVVEMASP